MIQIYDIIRKDYREGLLFMYLFLSRVVAGSKE
jgi:hypothetical protein